MHSVGKREPFRKGVRFYICHVFAWLLSARHGDKDMVGRAGAQSPIMAQQGNNAPPPFRKLLFLETCILCESGCKKWAATGAFRKGVHFWFCCVRCFFGWRMLWSQGQGWPYRWRVTVIETLSHCVPPPFRKKCITAHDHVKKQSKIYQQSINKNETSIKK